MRIDRYLAEKFGSRTKAARAVESGRVLVNGKVVPPSYDVGERDGFTFIEEEESFVSLGGYKLAKALRDFEFSVSGGVFADIGASTGGFTDCLLKSGAKKVYCIDVGESQLDPSLKEKNVVVIDNFNARNLGTELFAEPLDGAVADVSFISLTYILDKISSVLGEGKCVIALIKPQFECGGAKIGKNGIVRSDALRRQAIEKIYRFSVECGLAPQKITTAPIAEGKNIEYPILLKKFGEPEIFVKMLKSVNL